MEYRCVAEDRVLRSVEIDFAVNVQALAPPAEKATVRQDQAGQASTRNGGRHSDTVSKPNNPDPVTELRGETIGIRLSLPTSARIAAAKGRRKLRTGVDSPA